MGCRMPLTLVPRRSARIDLFAPIGHGDRQWPVRQHVPGHAVQYKLVSAGIVISADDGDFLEQLDTIAG